MTRMTRTTLDLGGSDWTLRNVSTPHADAEGVPADVAGRDIPATVPGCVHTDLLAAGLIDDPYLGDNELKTPWIGRAGWRYERTFEAGDELIGRDAVELCCDGLDTLAGVEVNGVAVGASTNMHVRQRFDVKGAVRAGRNTLAITFDAPMPYAEKMAAEHGPLPFQGSGSNPKHPHNLIRKMACNFGWDWGPVLTTSGVWRPIRLEAWDAARLSDVRPLVTKASEESATVDLRVAVKRAGRGDVTVRYRLTDPSGKAVAEGDADVDGGEARATVDVDKPQLWWPAGHGDQPLYELRVELVRDGQTVDAATQRVGLRQVELVTEPDAADVHDPVAGLGRGESMFLKINGRRVYCKGANWIPDDCFPHRVGRERYAARIDQAVGANMNMLRVWGGGLYESDDFYDLCAERGVMVWQDFLCACATYSERDPFPALFEAEARDNVSRLSRHTALVLYNGNNENFWGYCDWGWRDELKEGQGWGAKYYLETFPNVVAEVDPSRPYWPGSPYSNSPDLLALHPNANESGNRHIWNVWHGPGHYGNYLKHYPRFASEFGFHGPPAWPTVERFCPPDQRRWDSPVMRLHNKNATGDFGDGQDKGNLRLADDFEVPGDYEAWHYLAQVQQARALSMGVEWFRALSPWNAGALYWQLNDTYPAPSWSAIDGDGRAKPLLHASRRFFSPRLVTVRPRKVVADGVAPGTDMDTGPLSVYLHNDAAEPWRGTLTLRRMTVGGETVATHASDVNIEAWGGGRVEVPDDWATPGDAGHFLAAEIAGSERAYWWFAPDKRIAYSAADFELDATPADGGVDVTIRAGSLLRDVCVYADHLDAEAVVSDAAFTMLPGDERTLRIETGQADRMTADALREPPVFRCVNGFGVI